MTIQDDTLDGIAALIRKEIVQLEQLRLDCRYPPQSIGELRLLSEIKGLRRALAYVCPNPWE